MRQKEAIKVKREILSECSGFVLERCISLSSVVPANPKTLDDYEHYEVRIRCMVDDDLRTCIYRVVSRNRLETRQERNELVIYRPIDKSI
jgi:hypothetical protein